MSDSEPREFVIIGQNTTVIKDDEHDAIDYARALFTPPPMSAKQRQEAFLYWLDREWERSRR